jgi:3'-phosphoadenosine 5'-phosphosulfate sulfotransferase (PAPS reductase)/FAD synthetase
MQISVLQLSVFVPSHAGVCLSQRYKPIARWSFLSIWLYFLALEITVPMPYFLEDILNWNVYNWQHWWPNSYATLNPITVRPTDQVMGATLCAWGLNYEQLMSRLLENMPAMSERVWTVERKRDFEAYKKAFKITLRRAAALVQDK